MVYISISHNPHKNHPPTSYHKKLQPTTFKHPLLTHHHSAHRYPTTTNHPPLTYHHPAPNPQTTINQLPSTTNQTTTSHQHMQTIIHLPHQPSSPTFLPPTTKISLPAMEIAPFITCILTFQYCVPHPRTEGEKIIEEMRFNIKNETNIQPLSNEIISSTTPSQNDLCPKMNP